jgi:hypothetical protein
MPDALTTAARFLASRAPVATPLSAREIAEHVPQALRDASVFSARTVYVEHIDATQRDITRLLDAKANPAEIRARMKLRLAQLGYEPDPDQRGGLQDLSSDARTNLIISMQEQRARGYAVWRSHQDDAVMTVWPAQELFRALARKAPRDWQQRWNDARASLGGGTSATYADTDYGPFVALKNDPIWTAVSRFGTPYPPFDYQSGMRLRNVAASRARELGVLTADRKPEIRRDPMREVQSSSAAGMAPEVVRAWVAAFEGRAVASQGRVWVAPDAASVLTEVAEAAKAGAAATARFAFVEPAVRKLAQSFPAGANMPAHATYMLDAADVASGAVDAAMLPDLTGILATPASAKARNPSDFIMRQSAATYHIRVIDEVTVALIALARRVTR